MKKTILILTTCGLLALACSDDDKSNNGKDGGGAGGDASVEPLASDDELLKGCIISTACGGLNYPSISACVNTYMNTYRVEHTAPAYAKIYRCAMAAKGDCEAVKKCWGVGSACDATFKAKCEGNVAVSCDAAGLRKTYKVDCAAAGLKCVTGTTTSSIAYCTPDSCYVGTGNSCVGKQVQKCQTGFVVLDDCEIKGQVCGQGKKGGIGCIGETGIKCTEFFVPQCKGTASNIANQCLGGKEHQKDCSKLTLLTTGCKEGMCISAGKECDQSMNRCSGSDLEVCLDGKWKKYTCSSLGLGPCKTKSVGGTSWGTCGDPAYP